MIHHTMSKSMENYYQESGRAGRDGKRAECILLYRYTDIARITTMVFTEHTGLRNAYQIIEYAIDGISCRRDLISRHFMDVWSDSAECYRMCDRCINTDSVNSPKENITEHCLALYKIIEHANNMDVKLTMLKLIESWYQKGVKSLRVKDVAIPNFERFYAEQMVAFLIIKGYLKEDFHFSAYTTFSYIKKGEKRAQNGDRIIFYGARTFNLPELNQSNSIDYATSNGVNTPTPTNSGAPPTKKIKREKSKSKDRNSLNNDSLPNVSKDNLKVKKKKISNSEKDSKSESVSNEQGDDCVILDEGSDIIEID